MRKEESQGRNLPKVAWLVRGRAGIRDPGSLGPESVVWNLGSQAGAGHERGGVRVPREEMHFGGEGVLGTWESSKEGLEVGERGEESG